ncbi:hypothetical protein [Aliikangiella sp. IMCC44359]|uniref:hypothetical protein n=1 Tax=Aliikangiella sp. IMCC44359 TaxID=3459125 RepID=UPI00403AD715
MQLSWRQRLEKSEEYRDFNNWPYIDPQILSKNKSRNYARNREIIASVLNGKSLTVVAKKYQVSEPLINYLLNRALGGNEYEPPELTTALIPGALRKASLRNTPLSRCDKTRGCRGSFNLLLKTVPGLEEQLDKMLIADLSHKSYSQNITPQVFHKEFLKYCAIIIGLMLNTLLIKFNLHMSHAENIFIKELPSLKLKRNRQSEQ